MIKGIRGAISVDENTTEAIESASLELFKSIVEKNNLREKDVAYVEFTATKDLDKAYPAKFIRKNLGWNDTAFMCVQEMNVENSLKKCIRVLVVVNCEENFKPVFVYLKDAANLRG